MNTSQTISPVCQDKSVANHDISCRKPVCLDNENPECLFERFTKILTENQEVINVNVLKRHPYPSGFRKKILKKQSLMSY